MVSEVYNCQHAPDRPPIGCGLLAERDWIDSAIRLTPKTLKAIFTTHAKRTSRLPRAGNFRRLPIHHHPGGQNQLWDSRNVCAALCRQRAKTQGASPQPTRRFARHRRAGVPTESVQLITRATATSLRRRRPMRQSLQWRRIWELANLAQVLTDKTSSGAGGEKNHWLGYKTRVLLWWLLGIVPVVGCDFLRSHGLRPWTNFYDFG